MGLQADIDDFEAYYETVRENVEKMCSEYDAYLGPRIREFQKELDNKDETIDNLKEHIEELKEKIKELEADNDQ